MSDLISRADAIEHLKNVKVTYPHADISLPIDLAIKAIEIIPSADAVSRFHHDMEVKELKHQINDAVQGEWVCKEREYNDCDGYYAHYWYECSVCGARPPKDQWKNEWHSNYCPSCGARMKGGAE